MSFYLGSLLPQLLISNFHDLAGPGKHIVASAKARCPERMRYGKAIAATRQLGNAGRALTV